MDPLQLIGTAGGIAGALLTAFRRPWPGHLVWLFANGCWVAHGCASGNWYLVCLFGVYWVLALVGCFAYWPKKLENS